MTAQNVWVYNCGEQLEVYSTASAALDAVVYNLKYNYEATPCESVPTVKELKEKGWASIHFDNYRGKIDLTNRTIKIKGGL